MAGLPTEISSSLLSYGPAGLIILVLIAVIVILFKRWDADREKLIDYGAKYSEIVVSTAKVVETCNANNGTFIEAVQTFKLLSDFDRKRS